MAPDQHEYGSDCATSGTLKYTNMFLCWGFVFRETYIDPDLGCRRLLAATDLVALGMLNWGYAVRVPLVAMWMTGCGRIRTRLSDAR